MVTFFNRKQRDDALPQDHQLHYKYTATPEAGTGYEGSHRHPCISPSTAVILTRRGWSPTRQKERMRMKKQAHM